MAIRAFELYGTVGLDAREAERGLNSFNDKLNNAARKLTMTGGALTAGITVPLVAVASKAISMASDYEQSMSMIQYSTQASAAEMEYLSAQALQLGKDTIFSANEVAEAQLALAKAGMTSNEIIGAMPGILDLAAAADMELNEAAETSAEMLSMWNMEVEKSGEVANMLAGAANATTADVKDFTMGIKQSGAVMAGYNIPLDDTLTMLGLLANAGQKGSDAGTSLKTMFMMLAAPTDKAAQVLKDIGVTVYDANGLMRSSEDIVDNLRASLGQLSAADRNDAMKDIFGSDGMRAANILMESTAQEWTDLNDQINAEGNAAGMAAARMSGLAGALEGLSGSVDTFLLTSAQPFLETLAGWIDQISAAIDWFGTLDPEVQQMAVTIGLLAAAAGPAILALGGFAAALGAIGLWGGLAILAIAGLATAWGLNIGDMQTKTAEAIPVIQEWFSGLSADVAALGTAIQTAFANTSFPTVDELWGDFVAGDGNLIADKIRNTAHTLMVNLDAELNISGNANALRDNLLTGLTSAINGIDFGAKSSAFAGLVDKITAGVNGIKLDGISWDSVFARILTAPITVAAAGIKWVIGSENFDGLKTAVEGAIGDIQWGELGGAFLGLSGAIGGQLLHLGQDIIADFAAGIGKLKPDDFVWEDVGAAPEKTARSLAETFVEYPWETTGQIIGATIVGWWEGELRKVGALMQIGTALDTFSEDWIASRDAIYAEIAAGFDLDGFQTAWDDLGAALSQGFGEMISGLVRTVMGSFMSLKFDPQITKGPDPILSQHENLMDRGFDWSEMIPVLEWPSFVTGLSDWSSFVPNLTWFSFVSDINWESFVPDMGWGDFIPDLDWGAFIPRLSGNSIGGGGGFEGNASGTPNFGGGMTWVGERGPELVRLPRGTRIWSHQESMAMAGGGVTVNIQSVTLANDMDVHSTAVRIGREVRKQMR